MSSSSDLAVQATCNDASSSKKHAVSKGYWKDNFVSAMVRSTPKAKQPEINQGYYARTESIWILINKFLQATSNQCQIVSFGAGLDTTYWRLHENSNTPQRYIEMDFLNVVRTKIHMIKSKTILKNSVFHEQENVSITDNILTKKYCLCSVDLRNLSEVKSSLKSASVDFSIPTLFLTECVLVYMTSTDSNSIIKWIAESFSTALYINYEQVNMMSTFGKVMIENLRQRECELPGADMCENMETQKQRFIKNGWTEAVCFTMWDVLGLLPHQDVQRIQRLEFLDEMELLEQLLTHYCLCLAYKYDENNDIDLKSVVL